MIKRAVFFNSWHYGDLHSNKEYVRQFAREFESRGIDTCYATIVPSRALNLPIRCHSLYDHIEIPSNSVSFFEPNAISLCNNVAVRGTMYINTWIGHYLVMNQHNFTSQRTMWQDISQKVLIASNGEINIQLRNNTIDYVSQIDVDLLEPMTIPEGTNILFCNDIPISGQSHNGDWSQAVNRLASEFPNINFICTKIFKTVNSNIIFTNELTNREQIICDLPEIGHISEHCEMIITNSSGPGTFAMTRNNFLDSNKKIIAFVIGEGNTFWNGVDGVKAQTEWHPVFDDENVYNIVRDRINEKILSHSS